MANKDELVIRWLDEPVDAACALCESDKKRKFKKGPVISLVTGGLVCPKCAAKEHSELYGVYSQYYASERWADIDRSLDIDNYPKFDLDDYPKFQLDDIPEFKLDNIEPLDMEIEDPFQPKCTKCIHTFQPKTD